MTNLNQQILKFDYDQNFKDQDFYVSNSNEHSFSLLNSWPKWDKNFINIIGEKFSGKSHLINIFLQKYRGIKINAEDINNDFLQQIKIFENIIVEDLTEKINDLIVPGLNRERTHSCSTEEYRDTVDMTLSNNLNFLHTAKATNISPEKKYDDTSVSDKLTEKSSIENPIVDLI